MRITRRNIETVKPRSHASQERGARLLPLADQSVLPFNTLFVRDHSAVEACACHHADDGVLARYQIAINNASMALILTASPNTTSRIHPHLLPLHIEYSGPSPVSVYFVARDAAETPPSKQMSTTRAVFRGRAMHGIKMRLPGGYHGAVLRIDAPHDALIVEAPSRKRGPTDEPNDGGRRYTKALRPKLAHGAPTEALEASKSRSMSSEQSLVPDIAEDKGPSEGAGRLRLTRPIAHFDTVSLWNPDNPIDPQDEYIRATNEWIRLAEVVSIVRDLENK